MYKQLRGSFVLDRNAQLAKTEKVVVVEKKDKEEEKKKKAVGNAQHSQEQRKEQVRNESWWRTESARPRT
jgi:hypothetical protein